MTVVARCIKTMAFKLGGKMNERILELAFKLFNEDDQSEPGTYIQLNVEKFAELIVRECTDLVQKYMTRWPEDCELTKQIKEHFGVEE